MSKYTSDQKKEMNKLAEKYEKRGYDNTAEQRAKADMDRKIREEAARQKNK